MCVELPFQSLLALNHCLAGETKGQQENSGKTCMDTADRYMLTPSSSLPSQALQQHIQALERKMKDTTQECANVLRKIEELNVFMNEHQHSMTLSSITKLNEKMVMEDPQCTASAKHFPEPQQYLEVTSNRTSSVFDYCPIQDTNDEEATALANNTLHSELEVTQAPEKLAPQLQIVKMDEEERHTAR